MDPLIVSIREELVQAVDEKSQQTYQRFFKEKVNAYGCTSAASIKIATKYWQEVSKWDKSDIFLLCEALYQSGYLEEAYIASKWVPNLKDRFEPADIDTFKRWINSYITNWAACDGFCNHSVGEFIEKYPQCLGELKTWTLSENRWMRRAAAVSLIIPAKRGKYIRDVLEIADALLTDEDDMVRKGYGWLLKEASRMHEDIIFEYVQANKRKMPRTALRYAIELMPKERRAEAMKKD